MARNSGDKPWKPCRSWLKPRQNQTARRASLLALTEEGCADSLAACGNPTRIAILRPVPFTFTGRRIPPVPAFEASFSSPNLPNHPLRANMPDTFLPLLDTTSRAQHDATHRKQRIGVHAARHKKMQSRQLVSSIRAGRIAQAIENKRLGQSISKIRTVAIRRRRTALSNSTDSRQPRSPLVPYLSSLETVSHPRPERCKIQFLPIRTA